MYTPEEYAQMIVDAGYTLVDFLKRYDGTTTSIMQFSTEYKADTVRALVALGA